MHTLADALQASSSMYFIALRDVLLVAAIGIVVGELARHTWRAYVNTQAYARRSRRRYNR